MSASARAPSSNCATGAGAQPTATMSIRPASLGSSNGCCWSIRICVSFDAVSLWDVLEHIPDFQSLLANVREWLFRLAADLPRC